jgi:ankyrin repeat protein
MIAVRTGATDVIRLLLQAGADRNSKNTALYEIVRLSPRDDYRNAAEIVQMVIDAGANPNAGNGAILKTLLKEFSTYSTQQSMQSIIEPVLKFLLKGGANLKFTSRH